MQADAPDEPAVLEAVCEVHPGHLDALHLFLACQGQWQLSIGMGGGYWACAQSVNVAQEARWLGLARGKQALVVSQYRVIEREALRILNERESARARASSA